MQIPDFVDNGDPKAFQVLNFLLGTQPRADFASGYFNLGGYSLLREALAGVPGFRLLLSREPGRAAPTDGTGGRELYPAGFKADLARTRFNERNVELARELVEFLREEEVEVRLYTEGFFHGKAYVFGDVGIVGSSNFTAAGLTANSELNSVHKQGYAVDELRRWFERLWDGSMDYKDELIGLLEESKFDSRGYSPYEVFMKSLYEYFKDELEIDEEDEREPGSSLVPLANFQEVAYKRGLQILDRYDGLLVGDSVGLGKTWVGKKLLEHYGYFQRKRCLVVCPAQLAKMWRKELSEATIPHEIVTMEKLGQGGLDPADFAGFEVVLVDESHNFRNPNNRYDALTRITGAGRQKKLILLTATPINNGVFDLYNQISLFTRGDERYFAKAGIPYLRRYFIEAVEDGDILNLMEEVSVRRTRHFVAQNYPDAEIDGEKIRFPKRRPLKTERYNLEKTRKGLYEEISTGIEDLNLVSYNREALLRKKSHKEDEAVQRNEALISIMKVGFLKRFESSVAAFRKSVENQLAFQRAFLAALEEGRILDAATHRRAIALDPGMDVRDILGDLPAVSAEGYDEGAFAALVVEDVRTLESLRDAVGGIVVEEDDKLWQLAYLLDERPKETKTLVFTTYKDTAAYLGKAFREHPGLGLEGRRLEVLHGGVAPDTRSNVVERFAPVASKKPHLAGREDEIDVLVSTDVLSEGQNLQDADCVVNYDLHWNPTRMVQRVGRIDRLGSAHEEIAIHNFFPEEGLDDLLGLMERLTDKIATIDRNVGLEASILGEKVNPREFNALRRIEDEDQSVTGELEAEVDVSGEFIRQILADHLKRHGLENLERIPDGVHSGFASGKPGFFFHFRVRDQHLWRLYDTQSGETLESLLAIYKRIRCDPSTPRAESGHDVHEILAQVREDLLLELNSRIATSEAPTKLFKEQRDAVAILRGNLKHPTVPREDSLELLQLLRQPMPRTLRRELRGVLATHANEDYGALVSELHGFVTRYDLSVNGQKEAQDSTDEEVRDEDLELIAYLDLS